MELKDLRIAILGGGAVGTALASFFEYKKLNPILYKRKSKETELYKKVIQDKGICLENEGNINGIVSGHYKFKVTSDYSDIKGSNIFFICSSYTSHKQIGQKLKSLNLDKNKLIIAFPGKLGSSYLLGNAGEISSSPFGVIKRCKYFDSPSIKIRIMNRKFNLKFAHTDTSRNYEALSILNCLFGLGSFEDGEHPIKVGLQNHEYSLNVAAICSNEKKLLKMKQGLIKNPIYALGPKYTRVLEQIFVERQKLADKFGWSLETLEDWLRKREGYSFGENLQQILRRIYGGYAIRVGKSNRRMLEDPWALNLFLDMSNVLGIQSPATRFLVSKIKNIRDMFGYRKNIGYNFKDMNIALGDLPLVIR